MLKQSPETPLRQPTGSGKQASPAQVAAGQRNFATFQLKGMLGHLHFIEGQVPVKEFQALQSAIRGCLSHLSGTATEAQPAVGPQLESWFLVGTEGRYRLTGKVFGHPSDRFGDADIVTTSLVRSYDPVQKVAVTATGTRYHLGQPSAQYSGDAFSMMASAVLVNHLSKKD